MRRQSQLWPELNPDQAVDAVMQHYADGQRSFTDLVLEPMEVAGKPLLPRRGASFEKQVLREVAFERPDMWKTSFVGADLAKASLTNGALDRCDFTGADLRSAEFSKTVITESTFDGADGEGAQMSMTLCQLTSFRGTRLVRANLTGAQFTDCDFERADLRGAMLGYNVFSNVDLAPFCNDAPGHFAPSVVDFRSIVRSRDVKNLELFLVCTGIPELAASSMIASARAVSDNLLSQLMHSTFISYGGPDERFAKRLRDDLAKRGVRTFFFPEDARFGQRVHRVMSTEVRKHDRVILICSERSLVRPGVLNEIEQALMREADEGGTSILIPITLDRYVFDQWKPSQADHKQALLSRVVADFSDPTKYDEQFLRLLEVLRK